MAFVVLVAESVPVRMALPADNYSAIVLIYLDTAVFAEMVAQNKDFHTDTNNYSGLLIGATTNGDTLTISGNSGNLLAIQKDAGNRNIMLADPEAASQQNERMLREMEG